nr:MAG TPA: Crp-like helix-turn-helix domain protein [Caudoviricetes sp.]
MNGFRSMPKDVSCLLNISKGQYKNIIEEFKNDGLIEQRGYGDTYKLLYGIHKKKEYGGYCMEKDAYVAGLQNLQLQLERVQKELSQTAIGKINSVISGMNNISDLASNIGKILDIIIDLFRLNKKKFKKCSNSHQIGCVQ